MCYTNSSAAYSASGFTVYFDTTGGRITVAATAIYVNSAWDGNADDGSNVALIKIASVPNGVTGFSLYTGTNEVGQTYNGYGYGMIGTGITGEQPNTDDTMHHWENTFDCTGTTIGLQSSQLVYDFDDGTAAHDALGVEYGIHNLGLGVNEGNSAKGDSGGPEFIDGKIAAIVSFGLEASTDIDGSVNSTYGEISVDTRMSSFVPWVASVIANSTTEYLVNSNDIYAVANGTAYEFDRQSNNQSHSSVAMDADGDFTIAWTSYGPRGSGKYGAGYYGENGVYAKRYSSDAVADQFLVPGESDHHGQPAGRPWRWTPTATSSSPGKAARTAPPTTSTPDATSRPARPNTRPTSIKIIHSDARHESALRPERRKWRRIPGQLDDYRQSAVPRAWGWTTPATPWSFGPATAAYIITLRPNDDTAGPIVVNVYAVESGSLAEVGDGGNINSATVTNLVVTLSENVSIAGGTTGSTSILNTSNWILTQDAATLTKGIVSVQYGLSES